MNTIKHIIQIPFYGFAKAFKQFWLIVLGVHLDFWWYFFETLITNNQGTKVRANIRLEEGEIFKFHIVQIALSLVKPNRSEKSESSFNSVIYLKPLLRKLKISSSTRQKKYTYCWGRPGLISVKKLVP